MTNMYGSVKFKFVCESVRNDSLEIRFKNDGYYYKMVKRFLDEVVALRKVDSEGATAIVEFASPVRKRFLDEGVNLKYIWIDFEDLENGEKLIRLSGNSGVIETSYEVLCAVVQTSHDAIDVIFDTIADAVRLTALNSKEENDV